MLYITVKSVTICALRRRLPSGADAVGEGEEEGDAAGVWFSDLVTMPLPSIEDSCRALLRSPVLS